jgi:hypothetical protein
MTGFAFVTKRKLTAAIKIALEDGKFQGLNPKDAQTVLFYKEASLFWKAGYLARIITRSDGTIFIGYAEPCNPEVPVALHTML